MSNKSKRTPLYDSHIERGAKMGNFGGYDMPLWYSTGPKDEHLSVVRSAGIFDTSHMVAISVKGEGAFELLQKCYSKDLNACIGPKRKPLENGKCVYGVFLKEDGCVIDDAIVYRLDEKHFTVIVNAGMGEPVAKHLLENRGSCPAEITDLTDKLGKIDVQGPQAARIVEKVIRSPKIVFEKLPYFNFKGYYGETLLGTGEVRLLDGIPILLSRTGYTGEFGFEIFVEGDHTLTLWNRLLEAGEPFGALACGLAARDSLRAGAVLPLSHQDIGDWPFAENPWLFALPIGDETSAFTKDFIGGEALRQLKNPEFTYPFAGFDPRKVLPGDKTVVTDENDRVIGRVLTCVTDMAIGRHGDRIVGLASSDRPEDMKFRGLGCGFVKTDQRLESGRIVFLKDSGRRIKVEIVTDIRPARTARLALKKML